MQSQDSIERELQVGFTAFAIPDLPDQFLDLFRPVFRADQGRITGLDHKKIIDTNQADEVAALGRGDVSFPLKNLGGTTDDIACSITA